MSSTGGLAQSVVLSRILWLAVAPLLLGVEWHALAALGRVWRRGPATPDDAAVDRAVGLAAIATAAAFSFACAGYVLAGAERSLLQPLVDGIRIGGLEAGVSLFLDPFAAGACTLASLGVLAAAALLARRPAQERPWRAWAWLELSLAGALVSFLSEGLVPLAFGWTLATLAASGASGGRDARSALLTATRGGASIAALVVLFALVSGGLAGGFRLESGPSDAEPALAARRQDGAVGSSTLFTMTALPGASVFLDDARTPSLASPFVDVPLEPGPHTARVHLGPASNDAVVPLSSELGGSIELVDVRPTASLRSIATAIAYRSADGDAPVVRTVRSARGPFGLHLTTTALCVLLAAAIGVSFPPLPIRGPASRVGPVFVATLAPLGPYLTWRMSFLLWLAPWGGALAASALAAALLFAVAAEAGDAPRQGGLFRERVPAALGALLVRNERWVIGAVLGAAASLVLALAWLVARIDARVSSRGLGR